jgi:retron-type reverse transcriptase
VNWIVDAEIRSYFDTVDHEWLIRFVEHRIGDRRVLRLIRKWLKAGVMEDGVLVATDTGTPQGSVISPLLSNTAPRLRSVGTCVATPCTWPRDDRAICRRHCLRLSTRV